MIIVFTTTPTLAEAEKLAGMMVAEGLAACVQVLPPMTSFYVWEGELKREAEHLLLIKTAAGRWNELNAFITANHSYEVPEIVAVESANVSEPYAKWVGETVKN